VPRISVPNPLMTRMFGRVKVRGLTAAELAEWDVRIANITARCKVAVVPTTGRYALNIVRGRKGRRAVV
jgi:hypothetical protein